MSRELQGEIGALTDEIKNAFDRHLRERQRLYPFAADLLLRERLVAKLLENGRLELLARFCRVNQITGQHRVERHASHLDAVTGEHDQIGLQVVTDLDNRRILEDWPEDLQRCLSVERRPAAKALVPQRNVARLPRRRRKRETDERRTDAGRTIGHDTQRKPAGSG